MKICKILVIAALVTVGFISISHATLMWTQPGDGLKYFEGDLYTFTPAAGPSTGSPISLKPGSYDFKFNLTGMATDPGDQWEGPSGDVIWADVYLNGALIANGSKDDPLLEPQPVGASGSNTVGFDMSFDFYANSGGMLEILVSTRTSVDREYWEFKEAKLSADYKPAPVPEPATMVLLGTGLIGLAGFRRRKMKKNL